MLSTPDLKLDKENHRWTLGSEKLPGVTGTLKICSIIDDRFFTEEGKVRGDYVHRLCHYVDDNDLNWDTVDPELVGYLRAYQKFREDTGFTPILIEQPLFHSVYGYAGRLDRFGYDKYNNLILLDLKTGAIQGWTGLQLAGYELCIREDVMWLAQNCHNLGVITRMGLQLNSNGTYKPPKIFNGYQDGQIFLSCVAVAKWKMNNKGE